MNKKSFDLIDLVDSLYDCSSPSGPVFGKLYLKVCDVLDKKPGIQYTVFLWSQGIQSTQKGEILAQGDSYDAARRDSIEIANDVWTHYTARDKKVSVF